MPAGQTVFVQRQQTAATNTFTVFPRKEEHMKSVHRQRATRAGLLVTLAMLVASCAPAPAAAPQGPAPTAQVVIQTQVVRETQVVEVTSVVEATAAPATPAPGEVTYNSDVSGDIELWHFWASPVRRNAIRRVIAECKQQLPNINVVDTVKPFGDIWTANIAAVAAGSGMPDVIVSDRPTLPKDAADGVYMNLQEYADRDGINRDQFYGWAWDQSLYEGNTYGIPHETDVRVLFWNKNLFQEAGLDPEAPPTTWDELEAMADKLDQKNPDGTYSRIAFMPLWNGGFEPFWTGVNGVQLIGEDGTPQINDPKAVETLEWVKKWVDRYGGWQAIQNFRAQYGAPPNDLFMGGGVAMLVDIFGYNSQLEFYRPRVKLDEDNDPGNDPRMDWGIGQLPNNGTPSNWSGGFSMSIPSGARNADAAWEFIKCATSAQGQESWARDTQAQPTNIVAAQSPVLQSNPYWQVVDDALSVSSGGVYVSQYPNWNEQLNQRYERVWLGEITAQQALDEAQAAVTQAIGSQ
jgi:multiple sugar transport system substrate-binding protein